MSGAKRRNGRRRAGARRQTGRGRLYAAALVVAVLAIAAWAAAGGGGPGHHPAPRAGLDHAAHVVPAARYHAHPRVADTYRMVAAVPGVVDGIYCYCHCAEHSGHHSLLDCFASDHAARCDVCLSEATIAYRMTVQGEDLASVRGEIDARYRM